MRRHSSTPTAFVLQAGCDAEAIAATANRANQFLDGLLSIANALARTTGHARGTFAESSPNLPMIQTMFLCAGLGTRLLPLTRELPKPMVPIGDRPILEHLAVALGRAGGVLRAVNTHHRPEKIREFALAYGESVHVSHEEKLLGTAGGVRAALGAFGDCPLVVWNADILTRPNILELVRSLEHAPIALAVEPRPAGQGNVGVTDSGRIVRLRQESIGSEVLGGNYIGILAMRPECLISLPIRGCLIGDVAIPMMRDEPGIFAVPHRVPWSDVGSLDVYLDENLRWLRQCEVKRSSWAHDTAEVSSNVDMRDSIVGSNARVEGQGLLERVVVWSGAICRAPLADAIVTPQAGVVQVRRVFGK
jgi:mannose-1-phosphate guanylyltransferase